MHSQFLLLHFGSRGYYVQGTALRWAKSLAAFSITHVSLAFACSCLLICPLRVFAFVLFFCAAAGFRLSLMRWLGRIDVRLRVAAGSEVVSRR